ncbi:DsbA family oxidoreductase [Pradoshia sp.]
MKIEIWSDFVCPFCYIGKRLLDQALDTFEHKEQVEVIYKSYELSPDAKSDESISVHEMLAKKMGVTAEEAKSMNNRVIEHAASVGLHYQFDSMKQTNTLDAHRLLKYAETVGKASVYTERLFRAHFTESAFIGSRETLLRLAQEAGLDQVRAEQVLSSDAYTSDVRRDQLEGQTIGVKGVPFFVFNRKYAISGAQPLELFEETLNQVWNEENNLSAGPRIESNGDVCTGDSCEVEEKE